MATTLLTPALLDLLAGPHQVRINPITATVATTVTAVAEARPKRIMFLAVNLSANPGFLGFDSLTSSTRGIRIEASGGSVTLLRVEDGELVTLPVFAINNTASGTWFFLEVYGE